MKICQVLICQFSHHVIRLMKNLRQMRNTFLINSFRHKSKISENTQNNSHQNSDTDNCHELFSPDRLLSIRIMIFNIHSFRSFLRTLFAHVEFVSVRAHTNLTIEKLYLSIFSPQRHVIFRLCKNGITI